MKNSQGIKNTSGQVISQKKANQAIKREEMKKRNEENASFFEQVSLSTIKHLTGFKKQTVEMKPVETKSEPELILVQKK